MNRIFDFIFGCEGVKCLGYGYGLIQKGNRERKITAKKYQFFECVFCKSPTIKKGLPWWIRRHEISAQKNQGR